MEVIMVVTIMKALCVVGIVLIVALTTKKVQANRQTEEGQALWEEQKKHWKWNLMIGFVANFLDTLGIGSFAPSSALFKMGKSIDDLYVPGTLNVGDTIPVCVEAFLFFDFVDIDSLTLVSMLAAATLGAYIGAGIVSKWNRQHVRYAMFVGLFILATVMLLREFSIGPFGTTGDALALSGVKLVIGVVINFFLGALMCIGVGLYAPCLALVSVLGMNVGAAFPIMMGSCAYLMAFGNSPKFIKENRFDMVASYMQMIGGAVGVLVAYFIVGSMPISVLTKIVIAVVYITSFLYFRDARRDAAA